MQRSRKAVLAAAGAAALLAITAGGLSVATAGHTGAGFSARLDGFHEVPAVSTTGQGRFTATVNMGAQEISYTLMYTGLEAAPSAAHIHLGQARVNGGVIAFLCGGGDKPACPEEGSVSGVIDAADIIGPSAQGIAAGEFEEAARAMHAGVVYANVHSSKFPGGEIRGQLR